MSDQFPGPPPPPPQAPPGAYQVPVGGYAAPQGGYTAPLAPATQTTNGLLGVLALVLGGIAAVAVPIVASFAGFIIGTLVPSGIDPTSPDLLQALSPARTQVLWVEVSFWVGTVLGIAAIVAGIMAISKKQRRALGIAGLVLGVVGAGLFWLVLLLSVAFGAAAGMTAS